MCGGGGSFTFKVRSCVGASTCAARIRSARLSRLWARLASVAFARILSASVVRRLISASCCAAIFASRTSSFARAAEVLAVGALVLDHVPGRLLVRAVEVQHPSDRLVEQLEVVTDHEQRAAVAAQELHEPRAGVDVEVVRGLVEQQDVAAGEQDAGELDAAPLTTGEHGERQVDAVRVEAEAGGERAHLGLGRVAAVGAEGLLRAGVPGDVRLAVVLLHRETQLLDADRRLVEPAARRARA